MKKTSRAVSFLAAAALCAAVSSCAPGPQRPVLQRYRESRLMMGTYIDLDVCLASEKDERKDRAYQEAWAIMEDVNTRMNVYNDESEVILINRSAGKPVDVSPAVYDILRSSVEFNRLTAGAFDITVWPIIALWKQGKESGQMPSAEDIARARELTGGDKLEFLTDHQVRLTDPGTQIDLGGIAAGYAIDEVARVFRQNGVKDFYIDIGGDMYVGGMNCEGKLWRIGVKNPAQKDQLIDVLELTDAAIATSGDYEKYYLIKGEKWSHIINPLTGYPQRGVISATVVAPKALETDALSTAMCVLGPERGIALIDGLGSGYAAVILTREGEGDVRQRTSRSYPTLRAAAK